jgi:kumamolisin
MNTKTVALRGSHRSPAGTRIGEIEDHEILSVSIFLKRGADPGAIENIRSFAAQHHLEIVEESARRRTVKLEGTAASFIAAFGTKFDRYEHEGQQYRARTGSVHVPEDLEVSIEAVLGLDNRPQAKPHLRMQPRAANISYTPRQVAELYNFPLDVDGFGQTIGIIELGGGYRTSDLKKYFASLRIAEPAVIAVSVDGAKNHPTTADSADGEVLLDIQVAGAIAPGAKIVVYFAPNTDQGFLDALTTAIHDQVNKPSVISISWGGPECSWTAQAMNAFDSAAQDAAALGVTICAASGDNGSSDDMKDGNNHVDFPASSPHVLACGGTNLQGSNGKINSETVWNDGPGSGAGGGGFSTQFPLPDYQANRKITGSGRGVPDVCGDADPETGYRILVDGQSMVIGGTSAVAPLWSALVALLNQKLGRRLGFLNPQLYALPGSAGAFRDIVSGSNGAFSAGPDWDAATGLGSPCAGNLLKAL